MGCLIPSIRFLAALGVLGCLFLFLSATFAATVGGEVIEPISWGVGIGLIAVGFGGGLIVVAGRE